MRLFIVIAFILTAPSETFAASEPWSMDLSVFGEIFGYIMAQYMGYLAAVHSDLMMIFRSPMRILLAIYIVYVGCRLILEGYRELRGAMFTCMYISIVYATFFEWNNYADYVVLPIFNLGLELSAFFISAGDGVSINTVHDIFQVLSDVSLHFFAAIHMFSPKGSVFLNAGAYIVYFLAVAPLYMAFFVFNLLFFYLFAMSFLGMIIFFIIGGPVIMLAALRKAHGILIAWMKGVLNYFLQAVFVAAGMGILLTGLIDLVDVLESQAAAGANILSFIYLKAIIWIMFSIAVLLKAPSYAAHMSSSNGGGSSSVLGATMATVSVVMSGAFYGNYMADQFAPGRKHEKKKLSGEEATRILNQERNIRGGGR